jgi:hypothetical protein
MNKNVILNYFLYKWLLLNLVLVELRLFVKKPKMDVRKCSVKVTGHCHTPRKASRKASRKHIKQSRKDREDERLASKICGLQGKARKASRKPSKRSCGSTKKMKRVNVASHKRETRKIKGYFRCIKRST